MGLDCIRQAVRILDGESSFLLLGDFIDSLRELAENFMIDTAGKILLDTADIQPDLLLPREYGEFLNGAVSELLTNGVRRPYPFSIRMQEFCGEKSLMPLSFTRTRICALSAIRWIVK